MVNIQLPQQIKIMGNIINAKEGVVEREVFRDDTIDCDDDLTTNPILVETVLTEISEGRDRGKLFFLSTTAKKSKHKNKVTTVTTIEFISPEECHFTD